MNDSEPAETGDKNETRDDDEWLHYRETTTTTLIDEALACRSSSGTTHQVFQELCRRGSAHYWPVVLAVLVNCDVDDDFRHELLRLALREGGAVGHAAWWLMMDSRSRYFQSSAAEDAALAAVTDAHEGYENSSLALSSLLANRHLSHRLRALAGLEMRTWLDGEALVLMRYHLGRNLINTLEELERLEPSHQASSALERIVTDVNAEPDERLAAADALREVSPDIAEEFCAELAVSAGLSWAQRLAALEGVVELADSRAADAAMVLLRAIAPDEVSVDSAAVSAELARAERWP